MSSIIRLATEHDALQILEIYAPFCKDSAVSFETQPPTLDEMQQRITKVQKKLPWLVCERRGEVLGYVYAVSHRERAAYQWSVDVTVYIHEAHRRSGIGRALYTSLFKILVLQSYYNAYAGVALPNPGSERLHTTMGFQTIGIFQGVGYKNGAWRDVAWFGLSLQPRVPDPKPPININTLRNTSELECALTSGLPLLKLL
ncbi:GNAT family N-acetyltransferase [Aetokthonos hydrillicola Thurmond2011]|jgi:phosphinothricin acetyltransferase|uniref:GNAT family N-acetyltransferase n=1 Tax=Aetokthonos hydrillicola Thurmond2011 TaxID=2712845 RepID=A0AAP5MBB4_9CYAN|nr:arsinothricin resistance N-acetyltransferase ArsN1 family B [Aetokthonos hydrillicola]MBO3463109.1 N-acetyltransferase [Aetokthonos hydrillicola CCALA 1050]MBW4591233.1 GNAT family N-acetyltransferase [Aetokthonos hydrillicola CCALA 1050]MDR9896928.1 GNAT family N-acetyltransferase [Aetokthonos hydrillicola Thurmond2011]